MHADRRRRRRRIRIASGALLILALVASASAFAVGLQRGAGKPPNAATVPLPAPPADAPIVVRFLTSEGQPLLALAKATTVLAGDPPPEASACRATIEQTLPQIGEPPQLVSLAERVPDEATATLFVNHLAETSSFLAKCARDQEAPRGDFRFSQRVLQRRLEQLGMFP